MWYSIAKTTLIYPFLLVIIFSCKEAFRFNILEILMVFHILFQCEKYYTMENIFPNSYSTSYLNAWI